MNKLLHKVIDNPLLSGSLLMIIGSNANSFLSYIYNFIIAKMLGPSQYGDLVAIMSLIALLGILPASIGPTIVKFISSERKDDRLKHLINWFIRKTYIIAIILVICLLPFSMIIAHFINIDNFFLISIMILTFIISLQSLLYRAILQATLQFKKLITSYLIETCTKIILTILLIYLGFSLIGGVLGMVLSLLIAFIISRFFIRQFIVHIHTTSVNLKPIVLYSIPVAVSTIAFTSFISTDLIITKHFFSAHETGIYAAMSNFGKVIIFGTSPIVGVMFPIISRRQAEHKEYVTIFYLSALLTLCIAVIALILFFLLPDTFITIIYGKLYIEGSPLLIKFALFATLLTFASLFTNFHISLHQTKVVYFSAVAAVAQIIGIIYFHNNLQTVVNVSITVMLLLCISLFTYFFVTHKIYKFL